MIIRYVVDHQDASQHFPTNTFKLSI